MTTAEGVPLLLTLFVVDLLAAMSPGPNFALVTATAMRGGARDAGAVVAGLVVANALWCAAVVFGLAALFDAAPWLYGGLKVAGGAYLVYLGIGLWRRHEDQPELARASPPHLAGGAFIRGLLTNLSNPKSVVYFGSVFALFLGPGTPLWVQATAVAIVLADTVLWYGVVAALFSRGPVRRLYRSLRRPIDRFAGAAMAAFGARLVLVRDE